MNAADQAGPTLDARIFRDVMDRTEELHAEDDYAVYKDDRGGGSYWWTAVPAYSTDPAAALAVVGRMGELDIDLEIKPPMKWRQQWHVLAIRYSDLNGTIHHHRRVTADTFQLAVCKAALAAVEARP